MVKVQDTTYGYVWHKTLKLPIQFSFSKAISLTKCNTFYMHSTDGHSISK
jgi:hypothetical protein